MKYKIKGENFISVCSFCFPGNTILAACPELSPAVQISHGVCPACAAEFTKALNAEKNSNAFPFGKTH